MSRFFAELALHLGLHWMISSKDLVADVNTIVRPGGHCERLDRLRNTLVSIDQDYVAFAGVFLESPGVVGSVAAVDPSRSSVDWNDPIPENLPRALPRLSQSE